jgi:hypothetical protein
VRCNPAVRHRLQLTVTVTGVFMTHQADKSESISQASAENHAKAQPSGPNGDNPGTAGPGQVGVRSNTPENRLGHLNPSAPEDANTTPGTVGNK